MTINEALGSWSVVMSGQSPPIVDYVLLALFIIAACTQYVAVAVRGAGVLLWRHVAAIGWSLWSVRFSWAVAIGDDPVVPPLAAVAIMLIATAMILKATDDSCCDKCGRR